jgi:hypothetical protein
MIIPAFESPTDVIFNVYGSDSNGNQIFYQNTVTTISGVFNSDVANITINVGDVKTITLSGTITVTSNGASVPQVGIEAGTASGEWVNSVALRSPGANAPWVITLPAFESPTDVIFNVSVYDSNGNWIFSQGAVTTISGVFNNDVANITINVGDVSP